MNKSVKRLMLNKETVRALQDVELRQVAGGMAHDWITRVCLTTRIEGPYNIQPQETMVTCATCTCPDPDTR